MNKYPIFRYRGNKDLPEESLNKTIKQTEFSGSVCLMVLFKQFFAITKLPTSALHSQNNSTDNVQRWSIPELTCTLSGLATSSASLQSFCVVKMNLAELKPSCCSSSPVQLNIISCMHVRRIFSLLFNSYAWAHAEIFFQVGQRLSVFLHHLPPTPFTELFFHFQMTIPTFEVNLCFIEAILDMCIQ